MPDPAAGPEAASRVAAAIRAFPRALAEPIRAAARAIAGGVRLVVRVVAEPVRNAARLGDPGARPASHAGGRAVAPPGVGAPAPAREATGGLRHRWRHARAAVRRVRLRTRGVARSGRGRGGPG